MITRINSEVPGKKLYPLLEGAICKTMKLHTLEKVRDALKNEAPEIVVPKDVAEKSLKAVQHMLESSKQLDYILANFFFLNRIYEFFKIRFNFINIIKDI